VSREPPGAREYYLDATYYDRAYRRYDADVPFYRRQAQRFGGPVLELGAGTGRITRVLAEAGVEVCAVERAPTMHRRLVERIGALPSQLQERVELRREDFRELDLGRRFALVVAPFNVVMHLYSASDLKAFFDVCRRHLEDGGHLAFDALTPDFKAFLRDPAREYRLRDLTHPRDGRRYRYTERFAYDFASQIQTVTGTFTRIDDPDTAFTVRLVQRQFFPQELRCLLRHHGFEVRSFHGGFEGEPLDETSEYQVIVARPRSDDEPA
jgi:SAM-dependent methyltransferase